MNEVVELSKKELSTKETLIKKYHTALTKCEKATWEVAKVIYETINRDDFKTLFTNKSTYAKEIGLSPSTVSKLAKAYERKTILQDIYDNEHEYTREYTATQIAEVGSIDDGDLEDFAEKQNLSPADTCKEIRAKVKAFISESEESTEEIEAKDIFARFYCYDGTERANVQDVKISLSQMERILAILNE